MFRLCYNVSRIPFRVQRSRCRAASGNAGKIKHRGVAQLVARLLWQQEARGSSPRTPTNAAAKFRQEIWRLPPLRNLCATHLFCQCNTATWSSTALMAVEASGPTGRKRLLGSQLGRRGMRRQQFGLHREQEASRPDRWITTGFGREALYFYLGIKDLKIAGKL